MPSPQEGQLPADAVAMIVQNGNLDDRNHNVTITIPKKTKNGSTGSMTLAGGKATAYDVTSFLGSKK